MLHWVSRKLLLFDLWLHINTETVKPISVNLSTAWQVKLLKSLWCNSTSAQKVANTLLPFFCQTLYHKHRSYICQQFSFPNQAKVAPSIVLVLIVWHTTFYSHFIKQGKKNTFCVLNGLSLYFLFECLKEVITKNRVNVGVTKCMWDVCLGRFRIL